MTKISSRQLYLFLAAIAPVGKLVLMPTQLAYYSANDLLFPAAMNYLLQAGVIFLALTLAKSNLSLYALLKRTFGGVLSKIIITLFALFLFFAALLPIIEQKLFVQSVFYDTLPTIFAFSSFFLFSAYLCAKPLPSFGRTWDILAPLAIFGFVGIMVFALSEADFGALAPVGASGMGGVLHGFLYSMSWFFDSAIVLSLLGKIDYRRGMPWKGALFYLLGGLAVLLFLAVFYGVFQEIAVRQQFAFAKISKYFPGIDVLGRVDYLFIFALGLVMAFYAALPLQAGVDLIKQAYAQEDSRVLPACLSVGLNLTYLILSLVLDYDFLTVNATISKTLFWLFPAFALLLPALAALLQLRRRHETA